MSKAKLKKEMLAMSNEDVVSVLLQLYDASKEAKGWLEFYMKLDISTELEEFSIMRHSGYLKKGCPRFFELTHGQSTIIFRRFMLPVNYKRTQLSEKLG